MNTPEQIEQLEKTLKEDVKETRDRIIKAIIQNGPYSHNICGLALSSLAKKHGDAEADKLVDELNLESIYGIQKSK